ncbi:HNH endonuclease [Lactococcus lactis]|uniref:HNH endonuclease n=1 Tax=Lactococcus lactis TaxID=1358 RepID=UPI003877F103
MTVDKKVEMKRIPDYPDYAVTKDGRVWSYKSNKFLRLHKGMSGHAVNLYFEGISFYKLVRRLVFETFNGYLPEVISHKDGNNYNNNLDNLVESDWSETVDKWNCSEIYDHQIVFQVDPVSKTKRAITRPFPDGVGSSISIALQQKPECILCNGYLYYYEGKKDRLINEIKARMKSNNITIQTIMNNQVVRYCKSLNKKYEEYLEILESV